MTKFRRIKIEVVEIENGFLVHHDANEDYRHVRSEYRYFATLGEVEQALVPSMHTARTMEIPADAGGDF